MSWLKAICFVYVASCAAISLYAGEEGDQAPPEAGCSFRANPSEFLTLQARSRLGVYERVRRFAAKTGAGVRQTATDAPVRRNFIDEAIFDQLASANVRPAAMASDDEFVRRIYLDLTGRIPSPGEVRAFLTDTSATKRDDLIERLLFSEEFADKWTVWFGDLLQNVERLSTSARAPQVEGRNAFHTYLRDAMGNLKSVRTIAIETITASGNNYFTENGAANFAVLASTAMGPAQDTYDMMLVRSASAFLGLGNYDCLLCHSGAGHLESVNLWASRLKRNDAQRMAAFFSRTRWNNGEPAAKQYEHPLYNSTNVTDVPTGQYDLNTTFGNRPNRVPTVNNERNLTPEYRDGTRPPASTNWRAAFAEKLTSDPMFGRNFANRLWKEFFGMGLVDPVDTLDPARLDPNAPPPSPWTLQATHPELLDRLGRHFMENGTELRGFIRLMVQSSAYQMSSMYDGEWKLEYVPLFARHYPRRLDAEEIHDAITKATGVPGRYTWPLVNGQTIPQGSAAKQSDPVAWAMQLPDPSEPRNNTAVREFMRAFYRGNRDTAQRLEAGSIVQQLNLLNDNFVLSRIKVSASPVLREMVKITDDAKLVEELFLTFLSRKPSLFELNKAVAYLAMNTTPQRRSMALEDLAWVCINKIDFTFSY